MQQSATEIADLLPLTPASFHILLVLADGPAHGYAIMQETERMTGGASRLGPGTLYRTIQKLIDDRLLEQVGTDADERRVPYKITRRGTLIAQAEARRLAVLVRIAEQRRLLPAIKGTSRRGAHT
jgi:DNA-binding PadR family transcriptional regulator